MSQCSAAGKRTVRSYMIEERAGIIKYLADYIGNEGGKEALRPDVSALGSLLRDIPDEIGWKRVYSKNPDEQDSTGLLNDHWDRHMVMRHPATASALDHTFLFTSLPRGSAGKVCRDTVCGGNWSNRGKRNNDDIFSSGGNLVGHQLSYSGKDDKNYDNLKMIEITLEKKDTWEPRVALCLIYKVKSSAPVYIIDSLLYRQVQSQSIVPAGQNNLGTATDQKSSYGAVDSKSSPKYSEEPKNCTQMGIGNVACSSYNIQSKSLRDSVIHAVDAYLQDYPLEAAKIPDLSEDDNKFIERSVVHMLVGLGILPHIMESKYSVDENKRLGKRKVGPVDSSQVFEENKKALICEEPININNNVMHDFPNRGTTYSFDPSKFPGISQAPHVITTHLSQPKALCMSQGFWSASTTDHTMGGNTSQTMPEDGAELNGMIEIPCLQGMQADKFTTFDDVCNPMRIQMDQLEPHTLTGPASVPIANHHLGAPTSHAAEGNEEQQMRSYFTMEDMLLDVLNEVIFHNGVSNLPQDPENGAKPTGLLDEVVIKFFRNDADVSSENQLEELPSHPVLPAYAAGGNEDRTTFVASETGNQTNCDDAVRQKIPFPQDMQADSAEFLR